MVQVSYMMVWISRAKGKDILDKAAVVYVGSGDRSIALMRNQGDMYVESAILQ
jgi:hypothetical protein